MSTIGLDASQFNQAAERVVSKAKEAGSKVEKALSTRAKSPEALARQEAASWQKQQRIQMMDFEDAKRAREKDVRDQMRAHHTAQRNDARAYKMGQDEAQRAAAEVKKAQKTSLADSALGGAAKMFAGYMSADFVLQKTKAVVDYASAIGGMSGRVKSSVVDLQAWDRVLGQNGSSIQEMEPVLDKFNKSRVSALQGNKKQAAAAKVLGIDESQLKSMTTTGLVMKAGKQLESGENQEAIIAALQTMGGEGAVKLVEAFQDGFESKVQKVKDAGDVMTATAIASLKMIGDQWKSMGDSLFSGFGQLVGSIGPAITNFVESKFDTVKGVASVVGGLFGGGFKGAKDAFTDFQKAKIERTAEREKKIKDAEKPIEPKVDVKVDNMVKQKEEANLRKQALSKMDQEIAENARVGKHSVNSLQEQGGFLGNYALANGPEVAAMNAQVRSEEHLRTIIDVLKTRKNRTDIDAEDVEY
jgi:hypothetical protein